MIVCCVIWVVIGAGRGRSRAKLKLEIWNSGTLRRMVWKKKKKKKIKEVGVLLRTKSTPIRVEQWTGQDKWASAAVA